MFVTFQNPKYLFLLLAIPLLIFIHFFSLEKHRKKALKFANFDAIARIAGVQFFSKNLTTLYLSIIFIGFLSFAAAGMHLQVTKSASSFSFVIAVDASYSMETTDVLPSRLAAAKDAARTFVDMTPISTKTGIISFSGIPFIHQKLTTKKEPVKSAIGRIKISRVGGTNLLNAIVTAGNLLWKEDSKAVVIISDGQISVDTVSDIVKYANQNELVLNTIGVGTVKGGETSIGFISKLDKEALQAMAYETGGVFSIVANKQEFKKAMEDVLKISRKRVMVDMTSPLLLMSLIIFVLLFFLSNTRYRNIP